MKYKVHDGTDCDYDDHYYVGPISKQKRCCIDLIVVILGILFALTLGLILGAVFAAVILTALIPLIILAIILLILLVIRLIALWCDPPKRSNC